MNVKNIDSNQKILYTNHGDEVLYSFDVPVAGYKLGIGFFKNRQWQSEATSDHVSAYLKGIDDVIMLTGEQIENMFNGEQS